MTELKPKKEIPKFKIIFLGDQGTGKSCILNRFVDDKFDENYQATVGLDFQSKNVKIDNQDIHLLLYDTAGQEKFRSLIPMYTRDANIIMLVYDITRKESFNNIPIWIKDLTNVKFEEVIFVLIGNKIDLNDKREVNKEEGEKYSQENKMIFEEVSAKTGENFPELFYNKIFEQIALKFKPGIQGTINDIQEMKIKIGDDDKNNNKKRKCCK
jgi:Ras-related protein Rab-6A